MCEQEQPSRFFTWSGKKHTYTNHCQVCTKTYKLFLHLWRADEAARPKRKSRKPNKVRGIPTDSHPLASIWNATTQNNHY
jgi:hypothetical protein